MTLADLVETIAERYGLYTQLEATSGSTTTIVDTANLLEVDSFWVGHWAYVLTDAGGAAAAPQGEERPVTAYEQATSTLTVSPAFSAAVGAGDVVELLPEPRARIKRAINTAIRAMGMTWPVVKSDEATITLASNTYDYALPTDLVRLISVHYRDASDEGWTEVPGNMYWTDGTPGALYLHFHRRAGLEDGKAPKLVYCARPSELSADTDALDIGEPAEAEAVSFVCEYTLAILYDQEARADSSRFREFLTLSTARFQAAEELRRRATPQGASRKVKGGRQPRAARG
jgi:hypothetical protein